MKSGMMIGVLVFTILLTSFVLATDVAYVVEDYNKVEWIHLVALDSLGLESDIITDDMIKSTNFNDYHMIFVGNGNLMNAKYIPDMPMVLANSKYAKHFGFLNNGRTKSFGANANLMVDVSGDIVQVYDSPSVKIGGPALTYDYLPQKFMSSELVNYASTVSNEKNKMGSVIAFNENKNSCFFGISETKFWNLESWNLFESCVKFVSGVHDVGIRDDTLNSVNGLRIKDVALNIYLLQQIAELKCGMEYKVDYVTENFGDFTENVDFFAKLGDFNWTANKMGLAPGSTTTIGSKTFTITNQLFDNQNYVLEVNANIDSDNNLLDNTRMRSFIVSGC